VVSLSAVMMVHNEEEYLPQSLPNFFGLNACEYLFLLDRCIDGSFRVIADYIREHCVGNCFFVNLKEGMGEGYVSRSAFLLDYALKLVKGDFVLWSGADIALDFMKINSAYLCVRESNISGVSFRLLPQSFWEALNSVVGKLSRSGGFQGVMLFDRRCLEGGLFGIRVAKAEDTFLWMNLKNRGCRVLVVDSGNVHLRKSHGLRRFLRANIVSRVLGY
jgi:hypothetical protein